jgi:outer membrane protein assembly factor BamB
MFFILDGKTGMLRLVEANTKEYKELASAQILSGEDVWGPMALSNGKLIIRDMSQMVCLQVGPSGGGKK